MTELSAEHKEKITSLSSWPNTGGKCFFLLFCTVTPKGHLLREGAKVQGSQEKAKEADWLNANWQSRVQMSPTPKRKAITKLPNQGATLKKFPDHWSWVMSHGLGHNTLKEHTRGKKARSEKASWTVCWKSAEKQIAKFSALRLFLPSCIRCNEFLLVNCYLHWDSSRKMYWAKNK